MNHTTINKNNEPSTSCFYTTCTPTPADFLGALFDPADLIELRRLRHDGKRNPPQRWLKPDELAALDLSAINAEASVYFGANPRPRRGDSKNDHIALCRCVLADFDGGITPEQAAARIDLAALPHPSAIVASGGGTHCYWRLDEPTDPATWRATQKGIAGVLSSDNIHDPARVMRLPGTINRKPERNAAECRLVEVNNTLHKLADFPQFEEPTAQNTPRLTPPPTPSNAAERCRKYLEKLPDAISGQDGHGRTLQAACECYRFGLTDADAASVMHWFNGEKCTPPWSDAEIQHKLNDAKAKVEGDGEVGIRLTEQRKTALDDLSYTGMVSDIAAKMATRATTHRRELDPSTPYNTAQLFIGDRYGTNPRRLHFWRGDFYSHDDRAYRVATPDRLRAELYAYVDGAFPPTKNRTANLIDAAKAAAYLRETTDAPQWIGDAAGKPRACECLPMNNGILHLPTRTLYPHDPALFSLNALGFDFDADATCPAWLAFMDSIWADDTEQVKTLQEWLGYQVSSETGQQKIGLIVGPKRSGKGTIGRVMTELLGPDNVCAPTLAGLETNFGLEPLIGKIAATISDARLSGRADQAKIAERLLSISGEDSVTIDRKYREAWTGTLSARFTIMTNELPRLADASGALASRFVVMVMRQSFYGREDAGLTSRLLGELPGIFNWTLAGLDRLRERGHFLQPSSSEDAIEELVELGSPVGAFVEEACVVEPGAEVQTETLYREWSKWCEEHGRSQPGTAASFGRDLRAAVNGLNTRRPRLDTGERVRVYEGIRLRF